MSEIKKFLVASSYIAIAFFIVSLASIFIVKSALEIELQNNVKYLLNYRMVSVDVYINDKGLVKQASEDMHLLFPISQIKVYTKYEDTATDYDVCVFKDKVTYKDKCFSYIVYLPITSFKCDKIVSTSEVSLEEITKNNELLATKRKYVCIKDGKIVTHYKTGNILFLYY